MSPSSADLEGEYNDLRRRRIISSYTSHMTEKFRKEFSAHDVFRKRQLEAGDKLNDIEETAWALWNDVRDLRVMLRNLEVNRVLLHKR